MPILIFEGPRAAGKTMISQEIVSMAIDKGLPCVYWKSKREGDPHLQMLDFIKTAAPTTLYVVDRFHLTEWVMSTFHKRRPSFELLSSTMMIERALFEARAVGYVLTASTKSRMERLLKRADGRGEEMPFEESNKLWSIAEKMSYMKFVHTDEPSFEWKRWAEAVLMAFEWELVI